MTVLRSGHKPGPVVKCDLFRVPGPQQVFRVLRGEVLSIVE